MTDKTTAALKLAEKALVKANHFHDYEDALVAVREALAEPVIPEDSPANDQEWGNVDGAIDDLLSIASRLALELECLLTDTKDLSVVSKWWDSAHEALEQWNTNKDALYAAPVQPMKQEPVAWENSK